jgi:hypothetical protein
VRDDRRQDRERSDEPPPFDVSEGAWPCEDPSCLACELTPEDWHAVMQLVLEGKDVYIVSDQGFLYPLELRHMTSGQSGMTDMLRRVKRDARLDERTGRTHHSHTTRLRLR